MAKKNFESALQRLEQITSELEQGEPSLDTCLKKFDEGIELVKYCNTKLEEARQRIDLLVRQNGTLASVDFPETGHEDGPQDLSD
jgi:exodeoxyribonuclease VII small subunit